MIDGRSTKLGVAEFTRGFKKLFSDVAVSARSDEDVERRRRFASEALR